MNETIVAVATPSGRGGVGIIRLSGSLALTIAQQLIDNKDLTPRTAHFCALYSQTQDLIDEGLCIYFKAPHSFTGEDVVELQVHGSPIVLDQLMQECIQNGARCARPGEYSERAFLNNKIDLTQAEAIADLIHAYSLTAARMALNSLQGEFSKKINQINQEIINLRLFVEAAIDFPEEEIDFLQDKSILHKLADLLQHLNTLRAEAHQGAIMREGLAVVIAGRPNAGKSTLINLLAGRDIAIVTAIPGTTRDVMKEHILLDDIPIHIIDTAGLRDSDDIIEQEGIKRAWAELSRADCVLLVSDLNDSHGAEPMDDAIKAALPPHVPVIKIWNKIDMHELMPKAEGDSIYLSAKHGEGLPLLKQKMKEVVGYQACEGQFIARRRHIEALDKARNFLTVGLQQLSEHRAGELLAEDLRLAHLALCEITGTFTSDDLLGEIFSSFCIGK
jgi:tRNA modification GTPase